MSARFATDFTVGVAAAENETDDEVRLVDAVLTDVHGIELVDTTIVRPGGQMDSFGVWNGFPPRVRTSPEQQKVWRARKELGAATLQPRERINFVLHLTGVGRAGPLQVTYRLADGSEGTWTSNVRYVVRREC